jgi:sugar lactone lactonase YvrE
MSAMQKTGVKHRMKLLARAATVAGVVLALGTYSACAQNAKQRAALAQLGLARSGASANYTPPSGTGEAANFFLYQPSGLAFDTAGDLFIADAGDNVILEVNLDGLVSAVAGSGVQGYGGDTGAATSALLDTPSGVAVDASGNIYIADTRNNRIRKVSGGTITTIAGTGVSSFSGDGSAAAVATLSYPTAIALDSSNNIYIADTNNHRIREITGTTINTVAGNGTEGYSGDGGAATAAELDTPTGVAVDAAFNIYIGDTQNQRVRMVTFSTGKISTLAGTGVMGFNGDGLATNAELAQPRGVAVGAAGSVYVADSNNDRIRLISGGQITTIAGSGSEGYSGDSGASTNAQLDSPRAVAYEGSTVVFSDTLNQAVRVVNSGELNTLAGASSDGTESLVLSGLTTTVYGATNILTATFANGSNTATGQVTLLDGLGASPVSVGVTALSSNRATFSTSALSAGIHNLVATYPGDTNNAAIASSVYVLLITKASSNTALITSNATFILGTTPPTLTATVTSLNGSPGGTVNFYDGSTLLNATPVALVGNQAQLLLPALPVGLGQSLTAVYSGNGNFLTSSSTGVTENVITPDFGIVPQTLTQTVLPSNSVNYTLTFTPLNPTFIFPVTYSVTSTLPPGVTASFNPTQINAGASASSTVLTLTASAQARMDSNHRFLGRMAAPIAWALLLLPVAFSRRTRSASRRLLRSGRAMLALLLLAGLSVLGGCGGGGYFTHPSQSYSVTVTAVCGPSNHTTNVTLIVK